MLWNNFGCNGGYLWVLVHCGGYLWVLVHCGGYLWVLVHCGCHIMILDWIPALDMNSRKFELQGLMKTKKKGNSGHSLPCACTRQRIQKLFAVCKHTAKGDTWQQPAQSGIFGHSLPCACTGHTAKGDHQCHIWSLFAVCWHTAKTESLDPPDRTLPCGTQCTRQRTG